MGKNTAKNLVGQPIFKQVMKILPGAEFDLLVRQCGSDRYYKSFFSWEQLVVCCSEYFHAGDAVLRA